MPVVAAMSLIAHEPGSIGTRMGDVVRVKPTRTYVFRADGKQERISD